MGNDRQGPTRRSLAREDGSVLDNLLALLRSGLLDLQVAVNDTKDVESLALVLTVVSLMYGQGHTSWRRLIWQVKTLSMSTWMLSSDARTSAS